MVKKYKIDGVYSGDDLRTISAERFLEMYGTEIREPVTYKVGDRFRNSHCPEVFTLVALADKDGPYRYATMVSDDHFSFGEEILIGNPEAITQEELKKLSGRISTFTKIEDDK